MPDPNEALRAYASTEHYHPLASDMSLSDDGTVSLQGTRLTFSFMGVVTPPPPYGGGPRPGRVTVDILDVVAKLQEQIDDLRGQKP
jgi:hypothetical protein